MQFMMHNQNQNKVPRVKSFVIFGVIPFAFIAHIAIGFLAGTQKQWPLIEIIAISAALFVLFRMWIRSRSILGWLGLMNFSAWFLTGVFLWWTQIYSSYPAANSNLRIGDFLSNGPNDFDQIVIDQKLAPSNGETEKPRSGFSRTLPSNEKDLTIDEFSPNNGLKVNSKYDVPSSQLSLSEIDRESALTSSYQATLFVFLRGWW